MRELTGGEGVQRGVEIGGPGTLDNAIRATAPGGEIALLGFVAQGEPAMDFITLFISGATIRPFSMGSRQDFINLNRALTHSQLQPVIDKSFSFAETPAAWRYFASRQQVGKVVITFD